MKLEERFLSGADEIRRLAMQTLFERSATVEHGLADLAFVHDSPARGGQAQKKSAYEVM